nr:MAG TPA: tail tape measure protein [Caudoviricetes sp.]
MADYTLSAKITGDATGFDRAIKDAEKSAGNFQKTIGDMGKKLSSVGQSLQSAGKKITMATTAFAGIAAIGVKYNATMETYATSFEVMTGSAEKAADVVDELKDIAASTPFEMPELAETTQLLMNYGFTADDALEKMTMLGDISQGSADKMNRIATAYGQMSSAGKVSLEDVKQMIEAGFNPLQEISESTGESMESLYDRISAGTISVDEITASMQRSTSEGGRYFQSMEKQSLTFSGQMSTLKDNVQGLLGNVTSGIFEKLAQDVLPKINEVLTTVNTAFEEGGFQGVLDAIGEMSPALDGVITKIQSFSTFLQNLGISPAAFAGIVAAIGPAITVVGTLVRGIGRISTAISGISTAVSGLGGIKGIFTALTGPVGLTVTAIMGLVAAFSYLMATNDGFRESVMTTISTIMSSLQPILQTLMGLLMEIGGIIFDTIGSVLQQFAPVLAQIITFIGELVAMLAPLINQLISSLAPVITQIVQVVSNIIQSLMPPLISIIQAIMSAVQALMPPIQKIITVVVNVISKVMEVISPIISFVGEVIGKIVEIISPIIEVVVGIISKIVEFISPLIDVFATIFGAIFDVVGAVFGAIWDVISGVFSGIESAWNGLTGFVGGVVDGIGSAFNALVDGVKSVINGVIWAINGAIWVINLIPGVNIGEIPYLAHGTDNWQGGFAYMNEGGRGELTYLPNGSQVIPHDISVQYAKEAARANASAEPVDLTGILEGLVIQIVNNTTVDGTPLKEMAAEYTIKRIGGQQRAVQRARGFA